MKKFVALMMAICSLLSTSVLLASCGHTCEFASDWSKDATHHWHVCTAAEDCEEVADKAEHTWNAGEVTTPATATTKGVKTYTCTACSQTKTEEFEAVTTVTADEWATAMNPGLYTCELTMNMSRTMTEGGMTITMTQSVVYVFTPDILYGKMENKMVMGDMTQEDVQEMYLAKEGEAYFEYAFRDFNDDDNPFWGKSEVTEEYFNNATGDVNFGELIAFEDVVYDEATKSYKIADPNNVKFAGMKDVSLQFVDGKLVSFLYTVAYEEIEIPYVVTVSYHNVPTLTLPENATVISNN